MGFDVDGGVALAAARFVSLAALLQVFGSLTFAVFVAPRTFARMDPGIAAPIAGGLRRLLHAGVLAYGLGALAWLLLQTAEFAGATDVAATLSAVPLVLSGTRFGGLILLQVALVGLVWVMRERGTTAMLLAGLATAAQVGYSHAAAREAGPNLLLLSEVVHLLGAGAWLGGLLPLLLVVHDAPPRFGATAARWFSPMGQVCLVAMLMSAAFQGWMMVGSVAGLIGSAYGVVALAKLGLFGVLFGFALLNRYRFAPKRMPRVLARSIACQTLFGVLTVVAASILGSLPPPQ